MPDLVTWASPATGGMLSWFAESTVASCVLAALAWLGGRMRRPRLGPATRHILWLLVLVKLMIPPVVHWPWSVGSLAKIPIFAAAAETIEVPTPEPKPDSLAISVEPGWSLVLSKVEPDRVATVDPVSFLRGPSLVRVIGASIVAAWFVGSVALALRQARQVIRFRRLLGEAVPAPAWLVDEADGIGDRMAVRVPEIRVVPGLETPLLWCLGRPVLLIPVGLLKSLESSRWRAILAHELAHLRRRDHWVRRLELAAGLIWWWNPLYWLTVRHLDHEAEIACDAWVVWASPADRISYAETLIRIGSALTTTEIGVPSLGIAGSGSSFERRLTMILNERVDCRSSLKSLLAASMLAALAMPSWTVADEPAARPGPVASAGVAVVIDLDDEDDAVKAKKEIDDQAEREADRLLREKKRIEAGQELEKKFGPDSEFAKKMEDLGHEMEKKFGPDSEFAKKMETFGADLAFKFGPDSEFVQEIKINLGPDSDLGKELMKALGPDSEFAKEMKKLGLKINVTAELESKDAKDKAKAMAKDKANDDIKKSLDLAQKAKAKAEDLAKVEVKKSMDLAQKSRAMAEDQTKKVRDEARKARDEARKVREDESKKRALVVRTLAKPEVEAKKLESRIEALQSRIKAMQKELDELKAQSKEKKEEDEKG